MRENRRILLVNSWHDDNKGDSAITDGIIRLLKQADPDADLTVVGLSEAGILDDSSTRHIQHSHPDLATLPNPMPTELRAGGRSRPMIDGPIWLLRLFPSLFALGIGKSAPPMRAVIEEADLVVAVGGSNIYSDKAVTSALSLARLLTVAAPIHAARRCGVPVLLLGHTLGPFPPRRRATLRIAQRLLRGADVVVLRDQSSMAVARQLGLPHAEVAPDMAYATTPARSDRAVAIVDNLGSEPGRTAVIAMRKHPSLGSDADRRLIAELGEAVTSLAQRGLIDGVLVVSHTIGPTEIEDDRDISAELTKRLKDTTSGLSISYLEDDLTAAELSWVYGQMGCMIAVRLHAAILAMILGTPIFAISYFAHKTSGVMTDVGLGDCVGDFGSVTASDIVDGVTRQIESDTARAELAAKCRQKREYLEERSRVWITTEHEDHRPTRTAST